MMVKFKLISKDGNVYHYEYYPEGKLENKGVFKFDVKNLELLYHKETSNKTFNYFLKVISRLKDENDEFKQSGMSAWA